MQVSRAGTAEERRADKRLALVLRAVLVMRSLLVHQLSIMLPALINLVSEGRRSL